MGIVGRCNEYGRQQCLPHGIYGGKNYSSHQIVPVERLTGSRMCVMAHAVLYERGKLTKRLTKLDDCVVTRRMTLKSEGDAL